MLPSAKPRKPGFSASMLGIQHQGLTDMDSAYVEMLPNASFLAVSIKRCIGAQKTSSNQCTYPKLYGYDAGNALWKIHWEGSSHHSKLLAPKSEIIAARPEGTDRSVKFSLKTPIGEFYSYRYEL